MKRIKGRWLNKKYEFIEIKCNGHWVRYKRVEDE